MRQPPKNALAYAVALAVALTAAPAWAQEEARQIGASDAAELSWVLTTGNSEANTFGFRNQFRYVWVDADLSWEAGLVRAASRAGTRFAIGAATDFRIVDPETELDTNRLHSKARYQHDLSPALFWYAGLDAERNRPSNVNYRFTPAAGAGNIWADREGLALRTGYGISYTAENLELGGGNRFAGYQLFYELAAGLTASTSLESNMTFDGSFQEGDDVRFDWLNGVGVAINERLALKASIRLLFRNVPALESIALQDASGETIGDVVVAKDKLDTTVSTSLVVNF